MNSLFATKIVGGNPKNGRQPLDLYPTPPEATFALLDELQIPVGTTIWECACGEGDMVNAIKARGYNCIGTDIQSGTDYLTADVPQGVDWIITNPPFKSAEAFIRRSVAHGLPFAMLLKAQYWHATSRYKLFCDAPPAWVYPLTWRPNFTWKLGDKSPLMDVMWCVWLPNEHDTRYKPLPKKRREE